MKDRPALTLAVIEGLKAQGLNQSEIAELFGVTRQAVSWHVKTYGGDKPLTARQRGLEVWPWITDSRFG
jgi:predicted transcriptional regulator